MSFTESHLSHGITHAGTQLTYVRDLRLSWPLPFQS